MTFPPVSPTVVQSQIPGGPGTSLAELWRNLIPYEDLNAKGVPERNLHLGQEVLPTLAAVTGSSPAGPKLLVADLGGRLGTATLPYFVDAATDQSLAGSFALQVANPRLYAQGVWIKVGQGGQRGLLGNGPYRQVARVDGNTVTLTSALTQLILAGDPILLAPPPQWVWGMVRKRRWDFDAVSNPGAGNRATITIVQLPGFDQIIDYISADVVNNAATVSAQTVRVVTPGPVTRWVKALATQALLGDADHAMSTDMGLLLADNANNVVEFDVAPPAGIIQELSIGVYYEPSGLFV